MRYRIKQRIYEVLADSMMYTCRWTGHRWCRTFNSMEVRFFRKARPFDGRVFESDRGKVLRTESFPVLVTDDRDPDDEPQWATVIVGYDENDKPVGSIRVFD